MMRCRIFGVVCAALTLLLCAFSIGSAVFLALGLTLLLLLLLSLASVLMTSRTLVVEAHMREKRVRRGEDVQMALCVRHRGLIPVAPIVLTIQAAPEEAPLTVRLKYAPRMKEQTVIKLHASHVGVSRPGIEECVVEDLFGMFRREWKPRLEGGELLVLPQPFEVEALNFSPGDAGLGTMARASEDITNPSDVRAYAPGDAMKKIHWKLSLRKRELLVRRYEEPVLPDAVVLMDCARLPEGPRAAELKDAMLETAASIMKKQQLFDHAVRLPLLGAHPVQLEKGMGLPLILENLARADFTENEGFERILAMESRRMMSVGAVAVITAKLSGEMVEAIARIRKMGPATRLYLITVSADAPDMMPFISRLQNELVEVCYVLPQGA